MPICPVPQFDIDSIDPLKVKPIGHLLWIKLPRIEQTTDAGIVLVSGSEEPANTGIVVATGKQVSNVPVGSLVQFSKHAPGDEYTHVDDKYKFVSESDIVGIVKLPTQ